MAWFAPRPTDAIRPFLREDLREAAGEQVESIVAESLAGLTAEQVESFWDTVLNIGQKALPGVIQGVTAGAAGGPLGALIGGLTGGALSALGGGGAAGGQPAARPAQPSPGAPTTPAAGAQPLGGSVAVPQLLQLIQSPQLQQALLSLILGNAGSGSVPVGSSQTSAPPAAFLNLLGTLTGAASAQASQASRPEVAESYLVGARGRILGDPASPEGRAGALWEQLQWDPGFRPRRLAGLGETAEDPVNWLKRTGVARGPLPFLGTVTLEG